MYKQKKGIYSFFNISIDTHYFHYFIPVQVDLTLVHVLVPACKYNSLQYMYANVLLSLSCKFSSQRASAYKQNCQMQCIHQSWEVSLQVFLKQNFTLLSSELNSSKHILCTFSHAVCVYHQIS